MQFLVVERLPSDPMKTYANKVKSDLLALTTRVNRGSQSKHQAARQQQFRRKDAVLEKAKLDANA